MFRRTNLIYGLDVTALVLFIEGKSPCDQRPDIWIYVARNDWIAALRMGKTEYGFCRRIGRSFLESVSDARHLYRVSAGLFRT